jgi:hypothetical protein
VASPAIPIDNRRMSFDEVEKTVPETAAIREARRCLRCDLEFTKPKPEAIHIHKREEAAV